MLKVLTRSHRSERIQYSKPRPWLPTCRGQFDFRARRVGLYVMLGWLLLSLSACSLMERSIRHRLVTVDEAERALAFAMTQIGAPYQWGGRRPPAFDSSGIITWAYRQAIPKMELQVGPGRTADDAPHRLIYRYNFHPLPLDQLAPGDLVYITNGTAEVTHGAMFVDWIVPYEVMRFLDASSRIDPATGGEIGVTIQEWPVDEVVRGQRLVAVGRLKIVP